MTHWQADLSPRPLQSEIGQPIWELLICTDQGELIFQVRVEQRDIHQAWVTHQLRHALESHASPQSIDVFRPKCLGLLQAGAAPLEIPVSSQRRTWSLKHWLQELSHDFPYGYDPLAIEQLPPRPIPDNLLGDRWQLASLSASDLELLQQCPIPILVAPQTEQPLALGLASNLQIPGLIIEAGRRSRPLAQWLKSISPFAVTYQSGPPDGILLAAGLNERWVLATFEDPEVTEAGHTFQERQKASRGLHFLLIQPDASGMTYTGLWLLRND